MTTVPRLRAASTRAVSWARLATAPVGILAILISPWVGKNVARIDPRKLATVAFLGFALVLVMRSHFNTQADFRTILIPTVLQGAAMAFFFIPLQAIIFSGLTPDRMPAAAGLSNFVRITAGAIGTSIFTTAWENRAILHHAEIAETVTRSNSAATLALGQLGSSGYDSAQSLATINRLIDQQAYAMAATDPFLLSAAHFIALLVFVWITRPTIGGGAFTTGREAAGCWPKAGAANASAAALFRAYSEAPQNAELYAKNLTAVKDLLLKQRIDGRMMELSAGKNAAQHGVVAAQEGAELILLAVDRLGLIARGP